MEKLRIDKWLWAARFYKTRSMAVTAVQNGQVLINSQRIKPARAIQVGDSVRIEKNGLIYEIVVHKLNDQRRPASEASLLYEESEASIQRRATELEARRANSIITQGLRGVGRPSKRQRRQIIRFRSVNDQSTE